MTTKEKGRPGWHRETALQTTHTTDDSPVERFLSLVDGVKRTGSGTWLARCPAHADKRPSLSIRDTDNGAVLIHCFAGCTVHEVVGAVGLELSDLFPPRPVNLADGGKPGRRPFPAADILRAIAFEALIVGCAASAILAGEPFSQTDRDRLWVAVGRIQAALDAGGLVNG